MWMYNNQQSQNGITNGGSQEQPPPSPPGIEIFSQEDCPSFVSTEPTSTIGDNENDFSVSSASSQHSMSPLSLHLPEELPTPQETNENKAVSSTNGGSISNENSTVEELNASAINEEKVEDQQKDEDKTKVEEEKQPQGKHEKEVVQKQLTKVVEGDEIGDSPTSVMENVQNCNKEHEKEAEEVPVDDPKAKVEEKVGKQNEEIAKPMTKKKVITPVKKNTTTSPLVAKSTITKSPIKKKERQKVEVTLGAWSQKIGDTTVMQCAPKQPSLTKTTTTTTNANTKNSNNTKRVNHGVTTKDTGGANASKKKEVQEQKGQETNCWQALKKPKVVQQNSWLNIVKNAKAAPPAIDTSITHKKITPESKIVSTPIIVKKQSDKTETPENTTGIEHDKPEPKSDKEDETQVAPPTPETNSIKIKEPVSETNIQKDDQSSSSTSTTTITTEKETREEKIVKLAEIDTKIEESNDLEKAESGGVDSDKTETKNDNSDTSDSDSKSKDNQDGQSKKKKTKEERASKRVHKKRPRKKKNKALNITIGLDDENQNLFSPIVNNKKDAGTPLASSIAITMTLEAEDDDDAKTSTTIENENSTTITITQSKEVTITKSKQLTITKSNENEKSKSSKDDKVVQLSSVVTPISTTKKKASDKKKKKSKKSKSGKQEVKLSGWDVLDDLTWLNENKKAQEDLIKGLGIY